MTIVLFICGQLLLGDFDLGRKYYERGDLHIARAFFEEYIAENPDGRSVPEAEYYLVRISNAAGEFPEFMERSGRYLHEHPYGSRRGEIFNLLLGRLAEKGNFAAAFEYLEKYDYLEPDALLREKITLSLLGQDPGSDRIWDACPQTDTFRILRALAFPDPDARDKLFLGIAGFKGRLLRMENFLAAGDTVRAFLLFRDSLPAETPADERYRFTKLCRLFDPGAYERSRGELGKIKGYENKAALLRTLERGPGPDRIVPRDEEENRLWALASVPDTLSRARPDSVNLDSILSDTSLALRLLDSLRKAYRPNFHLDSMYAADLLARGRDPEAWTAVEPYSRFPNVRHFILTVQGFALFARADYETALKKLVLGQTRSAAAFYRLAECLDRTGRNGREYYRAALALNPDSAMRTTILKRLLPAEFAAGDYSALASYRVDDLAFDTSLLRLHLKSLARIGARERSDSLYQAWFGELDPDYLNGYGEYLIARKSLALARALYDSLLASAAPRLSDGIFYNWALVPFQAGEYDTALDRFRFFCAQFPKGGRAGSAVFKIATIKYQQGDFDSAGYYYLKSVLDTTLRRDALKNCLIAYKKAESWPEVIGAGRRFLQVCADEERPEASFEIGYAHLRSGNFRKSIGFFRTAVRADPKPEYHYWLAETYLGRGDFTRALYHYQAIVNKFPKDEMWGPTAEFKSGLALEFLDAIAEAKKLYEGIVKRRGAGDVWGAEAVQRLEHLK